MYSWNNFFFLLLNVSPKILYNFQFCTQNVNSPNLKSYLSFIVTPENWAIHQENILQLIIFLILITCLLGIVLILKGEISCWSLTSGSDVSSLVWIRIFPILMSLQTDSRAGSIVSPARSIDTPHSWKETTHTLKQEEKWFRFVPMLIIGGRGQVFC